MASPAIPNVPQWLSNSHSAQHLAHVLQTLRQRESVRDRASAESRKQAQANHTSRSSKILSSMHLYSKPNDRLVEYYDVTVGCLKENSDKNRYIQLEPYDRTRVVVGEGQTIGVGMGGKDKSEKNGKGRYLNASWVLERAGHKWWIATQAPLPNTAHTFLSIILQPISHLSKTLATSQIPSDSRSKTSRVRTVVQLTQNIESGRRKAHAYFPSDVGRSLVVPPEMGSSAPALKVTLLDVQDITAANCVRSTVSIVPIHRPHLRAARAYDDDLEVDENDDIDENEAFDPDTDRRVIFQHMLYTHWPDHGVPDPEDRASLLEFIKLVDKTNRDISLFPSTDLEPSELDPDPPIMVGCSAGIGRTGSFIALSSLLRGLGILSPATTPTPPNVLHPSPLGPLPDDLQDDLVAQEVDSLRDQRPGMVQREEQVLLIYETLLDALEAHIPEST
ncbi:protein-tyrosine phosphatase-like protein [Crucibulum laeve]|uniref:Protein-tyrosine phosphatase-like protein n=1 Tax=Crucibulum laeve TaxID=68775 RepID=A0A5C3M992_9AGAR|nr:protein-tyrosine phosphatase-like protein [Crucibulum laeve]